MVHGVLSWSDSECKIEKWMQRWGVRGFEAPFMWECEIFSVWYSQVTNVYWILINQGWARYLLCHRALELYTWRLLWESLGFMRCLNLYLMALGLVLYYQTIQIRRYYGVVAADAFVTICSYSVCRFCFNKKVRFCAQWNLCTRPFYLFSGH